MGLGCYGGLELTLGKWIHLEKKKIIKKIKPKLKISACQPGGGGKEERGELAGGAGACTGSPRPRSVCRRRLRRPFSVLAFKLAMLYGNK